MCIATVIHLFDRVDFDRDDSGISRFKNFISLARIAA